MNKLSWGQISDNPFDYVGWLVRSNSENNSDYGVIQKIEEIEGWLRISAAWYKFKDNAIRGA